MMQLQGARPLNEQYCLVESQMLGKGSTGNVYLGLDRTNPHRRVAVKTINLKEVDNEVTRYLLSCEIAALSNLGKLEHSHHDNIVRLLDVVIQDHFIYLVTELLEGGTLADYIKRFPNGLPEEDALYLFRQILQGYRHMRLKNIVHRDLKPDNILFRVNPDQSKRLAIIDFGYCQMEEVPNRPQMYYNVGSPRYMAPQAYQDNHYSQKSDIWALGVILYELLVGKTCDQGMSMDSYLQMVRKNGIPLPQHLSPFIKQLLSCVLHYSHQNRYDCHQTLRELDLYQNAHHAPNGMTSLQSSLHPQRSEIVLKKDQEDSRHQDTFQMKNNRNNVVFRSAMQPHPPSQPSITIVSPPQHPLQEEHNENIYIDKKLLKSSSVRNPTLPINPLVFQPQQRQPAQQILGHVENIDPGSNRHIVHRRHETYPHPEYYSQQPQPHPQPQQPHMHTILSRPQHHSNGQPSAHTQLQQMFHTSNRMDMPPSQPHPHPHQALNFSMMSQPNIQGSFRISLPGPLPERREQRFNSHPHPQDHSFKILMKSANLQRPPPNLSFQLRKASIEKRNDHLTFHSPEKSTNTLARKVQFFTQKKLNSEKEPVYFRPAVGGSRGSEMRVQRMSNLMGQQVRVQPMPMMMMRPAFIN